MGEMAVLGGAIARQDSLEHVNREVRRKAPDRAEWGQLPSVVTLVPVAC